MINKILKFFTSLYYLFVRKTNSSRFFNFLYKFNSDPFEIKNSEYEKIKFNVIVNIIKNKKYKTILDLGCGTGVLTYKISHFAEKTIGIDLSDNAIKIAKNQFKNPGLEFKNADICNFSSSVKFNLFLCSEILYYLNKKEILKFLEVVHKLSSKDSELIFIGRADDNFVKPILNKRLTLLKSINKNLKFNLYKLPFMKIRRPFKIDIFKIK